MGCGAGGPPGATGAPGAGGPPGPPGGENGGPSLPGSGFTEVAASPFCV